MTILNGVQLDTALRVFCISMVPLAELRVGLPYGIAAGLPLAWAIAVSVAGNLLPTPFIILLIRRIFAVLRTWNSGFDRLVAALENRAQKKGELVRQYGFLGLFLLVAIPLPGTGAWTGALVAAILDIRLKKAIPAIFFGVITAALLMTFLTYGAISVF